MNKNKKRFLDKVYTDYNEKLDELYYANEYFNRVVESNDYEAIEQFMIEYNLTMNIYMVEVGIELENNDKEFEAYKIEFNGKVKNWKSLYDENVIAFLDKQEAKDYIDKYVKKGVKNTYGFMWEVEREVEEVNLEELFETYLLEDCFYEQQKILYFKGGIE